MNPQNIVEQIKSNPFSILGMQPHKNHYRVLVFHPNVDSVILKCENNEIKTPICHDNGVFEFNLLEKKDYLLEFEKDSESWCELDPYSFPPMISDYDLYLFREGTHRQIWKILGAHLREVNGVKGINFAVWAPNAKSVRVIGDFNFWNKERYFMNKRDESGIWEIFIPNIERPVRYKYAIESQNEIIVEKADPCAFFAEKSPKNASITYDVSLQYQWNDQLWMSTRSKNIDRALSIYECHIDSWIRHDGDHAFSYAELAKPLTEYLKEHGFTHVEFMPLSEYPYTGSWGYQVTGYFAPTSRYGTPMDFKYLIDYLHQHQIGVIMDWVPAHFPSDEHGLANFDGTALYEHADPRQGWHNDWKTHIFNYGRLEVRQFLISNALFWLEQFHIDGLRVDAVASMLYLDYSRNDGDWIPNKYGSNENLEAIEFLQSLNAEINKYFPTAMTIAEESTSYPGVTASTSVGGLGFTYKWNMGWMNDTLRYFAIPPIFRYWHHNDITFSLIYAFSERYILPFSHDEVVHGKGTLLNRMPGNEWEKFANLRLMFTYMWCHPGKKLLFAGQEWAPWQEWTEQRSIDWHLNHNVLHSGIRFLIKDLNTNYQQELSLFQIDSDPRTFRWIDCNNTEVGILMWIREDYDGNKLLIVLNLNTIVKENFEITVPLYGTYQEIFNSDHALYGGANILNSDTLIAYEKSEQNYCIAINIAPLAGMIFKIN